MRKKKIKIKIRPNESKTRRLRRRKTITILKEDEKGVSVLKEKVYYVKRVYYTRTQLQVIILMDYTHIHSLM